MNKKELRTLKIIVFRYMLYSQAYIKQYQIPTVGFVSKGIGQTCAVLNTSSLEQSTEVIYKIYYFFYLKYLMQKCFFFSLYLQNCLFRLVELKLKTSCSQIFNGIVAQFYYSDSNLGSQTFLILENSRTQVESYREKMKVTILYKLYNNNLFYILYL